ncbi:hypothetical protein [Syntrophomonas palmitatica]|uniref:hypothetical protein n=1 Tax=Syntrophomonas palmitatica TaxID=402877 RepID=UPI0006D05E51|nr:hypothetical protein [Syntrophomonas palmitatica]
MNLLLRNHSPSLTYDEIRNDDLCIPEELKNSASRIISYANISAEQGRTFLNNLESFRILKDKSIYDPHSRKLLESISKTFFEIYVLVLKRVLSEKNDSRLLQMFLRYCYMDEKLLKPEQVISLYELVDQEHGSEENSTYVITSWLELILNRKKDPSINQFGQDYYEVFREMKKRGQMDDRDKAAYDADTNRRLQHEIDNLLQLGQRLCCGHGGYFPILHSEQINQDITQTLVDNKKISASLNRILEIDFSAFHREIVYSVPEKGIKRELIMIPVMPEIILIPTFGSRGVMWQELTGRVRTTAGRFIFPIFSGVNLDKLMVEVVARFRWELSRTMFNYARNDSYQNSLTGDYSSYIQFYKKNRDLSAEAKEKLKTQIDKHRNNIIEIFTSDYDTWINFEAQGLIRLNKVCREIMFKHCPFSRPVRDQLEKQPLYTQMITKYNNIRNKENRLMQAHFAKLTPHGSPMDPNLTHHLNYSQS